MKIKPADKSGGVILEMGPDEKELPCSPDLDSPRVLQDFKLKKILVPVDFSECSVEAMLYAVPLGKQFDAEITLLHVIEPPPIPPPEGGMVVELESTAQVKKSLKEMKKQIQDGPRCHLAVRNGNAEYEIIQAAKELQSDLIILSTHGRTGLIRLVMGSTADYVTHHAGCPILLLRPNEREFVKAKKN